MDEAIKSHCAAADEVWHAGDIGEACFDYFKNLPHCKAVYGNIDGPQIQSYFPEYQFIQEGECKIVILHIANRTGKYSSLAKKLVIEHSPQILITGHSHILLAKNDTSLGSSHLHLNPGAIGKHGWHKKRTMMRFLLSSDGISELEVIEYPR